MSDRTTAYAAAILEIGRAEGALDAVTDELRQLATAVRDNHELRDALTNPALPVGRRLTLLETEVARQAAADRERELAEVTVAVPLDSQRREALKAALERATGKELELQVVVDPDVVGGVRAIVGDTVFDGSLANRLQDVKTRIAG